MKERILKKSTSILCLAIIVCMLAVMVIPSYVRSAQVVVSNMTNTGNGIGKTSVFTIKINGYSNLYCVRGGADLYTGNALNEGQSMYSLQSGTIVTNPSGLQWLLDNMYLTEATDENLKGAMKENLKYIMRKYNNYKDSNGDYCLSKKLKQSGLLNEGDTINADWISACIDDVVADTNTLFTVQQYVLWNNVENKYDSYDNTMENSDGTYNKFPNNNVKAKQVHYTALYITLNELATEAQKNGYVSPNVSSNTIDIALEKQDSTKASILADRKTALIGPLKLRNNNAILNKVFTAKVNSEDASKVETVDANGNAINVKETQGEFYVKVSYEKGFVKGEKYSFDVNVALSGIKTTAILLDTSNGYTQPLTSISKELFNTSSGINVEEQEELTGYYSLILEKVDSTDGNKKVSGVTFKVKEGAGEEKTYGPTIENGIVEIYSSNNPKKIEAEGIDEYTITEVQVDEEKYITLKDAVTIYVTKSKTSEAYVPSKVSLEKDSDTISKEVTLKDGSKVTVSVTLVGNTVKVTIPNKPKIELKGEYSLILEKVDSTDGNKKVSGVTFKVKEGAGEEKTYGPTIENGIVEIYSSNNPKKIEAEGIDEYTITEVQVDEEKYITLKDAVTIYVTKSKTSEAYVLSKVSLEKDSDVISKEVTLKDGSKVAVSVGIVGNTVKVTIPNKPVEEPKDFDMALRKFISEVKRDGQSVNIGQSREPVINAASAAEYSKNKTAGYYHTKDPVTLKTGDTVIYTIRVYNEGYVDGFAKEITDYLPQGLEYIEDSQINKENGWLVTKNDDGTTIIKTNKLNDTLIKAANGAEGFLAYSTKLGSGSTEPAEFAKDIQIECKVKAEVEDNKLLVNVAEITNYGYNDKDGNYVEANTEGIDIDSEENNVYTKRNDVKDIDSYYDKVVKTQNTKDHYKGIQDDDDFENILIVPDKKKFDLALRKFITGVNDKEITSRKPVFKIDKNGNYVYDHDKNPVLVESENVVTYTLRVYNEGEIDGYAKLVADNIPEGLEFLPENELNKEQRWVMYTELGENDITIPEANIIEHNKKKYIETKNAKEADIIVTDYLSKEQEKEAGSNLIKAFDKEAYETGKIKEPDYKDLKAAFKVTAPNTSNEVIINQAQIVDDSDEEGNDVEDSDSTPNEWIEGEDDQDIEKIRLEYKKFDLALRKFITGVNDKEITSRIPKFKVDKDGKYVYNHDKEPVTVGTENIVTYTLRVYNEGEINGYAEEVKDDIPEGLEFLPDNELNKSYRWLMFDKDGKETDNSKEAKYITTDYLSKAQEKEAGSNLIKAFDKDAYEAGKIKEPDYKEVEVAFKVLIPDASNEIIINHAQISDDADEEGNDVEDTDSTPNEWNEGEDDQDTEKIKVQCFDLALRKFITGVNDKKVTSRIPVFKVDKNGNYVYNHDKEPVLVANNNIVTYTLRVYNEGNINGYAKEVKDNIPEGLEFLPENELNKEFRWVMLDKDGKETTESINAKYIITDYLSKEQEKEEGSNLLKAFDEKAYESGKIKEPDYKEVKVAFKVVVPDKSNEIIINHAQISDDSDENGNDVTDIDSTPDEWIDGEDDQDIEKIKPQYFDLSLRKWVTKAIVTENGKETITETGHKAEDDPEAIVKVDLKNSDINKVKVKFEYKIRVKNEGQIPGYAKEIRDDIPEGLEFVQEDNKNWKVVDGKVVTDELKDTLLKPGETAEVTIVLTWKNAKDNMGLKTNVAEISKDFNEYGAPDIDSTPNNNVPGEDDIDDAPVMLTVKTGQEPVYVMVAISSLGIIAGGVIGIKKFVL